MKTSVFLCAAVLALFGTTQAHSRRVASIHYNAVTPEPSRRVYFYDPSGSEDQLLSLKEQLIDRGAYHVNVFLPSHVVCMLPETVSAKEIVRGTNVAAFEEDEIQEQAASGAFFQTGWLKECYALAKRGVTPDEGAAEIMKQVFSNGARIDSVGTVPPETIAASIHASPGASEAPVRRIDQCSEFMLGNIMINVILPESRYHLEDWSAEDKTLAIKGFFAALMRYQDLFPYASMNFIVRKIEDVYTYYEPSHTRFDEYEQWILSVMSYLDWDFPFYYDAPRAIYDYHMHLLQQYGADWIFTAFIIHAQNTQYHQITGADFVTFALRGGPYMVVPYPTGPLSDLFERSFVTSLYVEHDIGHMFWAMDEWIYAQGFSCYNSSGYLNYINGNKVEKYILGNMPVNECVGVAMPCIMDYVEKHLDGWVCEYTAGQMGIVDWNGNDVPDIFDSAPIVEFEGGEAETLAVDTFMVHCKAISVPIPNRNYHQDTTYWIDYAATLKDGVLSISGADAMYIKPVDGRWDEVEEDLRIPLRDLQPGLTSVEITLRNSAGLKSPPRVKRLLKAGLSYSLFTANCRNDGIDISWYMIGETFNARFDLYRIESTDGISDTTLIAYDLKPSGDPQNQFLPFRFFDSDTEPNKTYWFFIRGTYTLSIQGGPPQTMVNDSQVFKAMAIIPIPEGDMMSQPTPNPFRESTRFSVIVPRSYKPIAATIASRAPSGVSPEFGLQQEVPTLLVIKVYDVMGRPIKTVLREKYFGTTVTAGWDGTNDRNEGVPAGMYFVRAEAGSKTQVRKVIVLR